MMEENVLIELTAQIVSAFVGNNGVRPSELPDIIANVHGALIKTSGSNGNVEPVVEPMPAGAVRKSITADHLISFEDGKKYKTLKRHLSKHQMTPEEYRAKWGLPVDYPMVAPNYAEARSGLAKKMGLGRRAA